jgi:signal transduction histidine kinase
MLNNISFVALSSLRMDGPLRETLLAGAPGKIELYAETLDDIRFPNLEPELLAMLRKKYAGTRIDLIIARNRTSLDFVERYRGELWPDAPVIFYNTLEASIRTLPDYVTGVTIDLDPEGTLALALRLQPQTRHVVVITGTQEYDRNWRRRLERIFARFADRVSVTYLEELPMAQILEYVARLPSETIVYFSSLGRDASATDYISPDVAERVAATSSVPLCAFIDDHMGRGAVGGSITDFPAQGRAAAQLALRVLKGELPSTIPIQESPPARCVVDYRQIQRWKINATTIPSDCDIRFRPPSIWRDYRWEAIGAIVAVILQSLLITSLIIQRRWRREAERAAQHKQAELEQASRLALVGELTASIAHEINLPLAAIGLNTETAKMLYERGQPDLEELRQIVSDIRADNIRACEVIQRVRALLGQRALKLQPVDLNAVVSDVVRMVRGEADRRDLVFEEDLTPGLPAVLGDRVELQQVLLNLIVNAMDTMANTEPNRRKLTVRTTRSGSDAAEAAVIDRGHGIAATHLPKLFESFFTTKSQGMGLGLSIAHSIVAQHGGRIWAANNPDGGATFRFTLPFTSTP